MLHLKKGTSIISLTLAAVAIALTTTALVIATNNSAMYRAQMQKNNSQQVESYAYTKVYAIDEIRSAARQAYTNNYLSFYNNEVNLEGFETLIIEEMMQEIPQKQMEDFVVQVTPDGVYVEYK